MQEIRSVAELEDVAEPVWPILQEAVAGAAVPVEVLGVTPEQGREVLHRLQVTTRSALGALARHCGGLAIDGGWLRILGGGYSGGRGALADLATTNGILEPPGPGTGPRLLVVAHDVLGGRFAVDGGALGLGPGEVCYWAPDSLDWESLEIGHGAFVEWALGGGTTEFYADLRWPGWEADVTDVRLDEGLTAYPPPWSAEGQGPGVTRRAVPFGELVTHLDETARRLRDLPDGGQVLFRTED